MPLTPFWHPLFVAWKSLPLPLGNPPLLTWKSLLCVVARIPVHSGPRLAVYWPPPTPPFPFPPPNGSPYLMHALSRRHCDIGFTYIVRYKCDYLVMVEGLLLLSKCNAYCKTFFMKEPFPIIFLVPENAANVKFKITSSGESLTDRQRKRGVPPAVQHEIYFNSSGSFSLHLLYNTVCLYVYMGYSHHTAGFDKPL